METSTAMIFFPLYECEWDSRGRDKQELEFGTMNTKAKYLITVMKLN